MNGNGPEYGPIGSAFDSLVASLPQRKATALTDHLLALREKQPTAATWTSHIASIGTLTRGLDYNAKSVVVNECLASMGFRKVQEEDRQWLFQMLERSPIFPGNPPAEST